MNAKYLFGVGFLALSLVAAPASTVLPEQNRSTADAHVVRYNSEIKKPTVGRTGHVEAQATTKIGGGFDPNTGLVKDRRAFDGSHVDRRQTKIYVQVRKGFNRWSYASKIKTQPWNRVAETKHHAVGKCPVGARGWHQFRGVTVTTFQAHAWIIRSNGTSYHSKEFGYNSKTDVGKSVRVNCSSAANRR